MSRKSFTDIAPTITTRTNEDNNNFIMEREQIPLNTMPDGTSRTIKAQYQQSSPANFKRNDALGATGVTCNYRIRKLTPRECFRLMDVSETDIDKIQAAGISDSQQYKMAGNSIVVACLYHIFDRLFINTKQTELTLF